MSVVAKVAALLQLAEGAGTTPAEAATAASVAQRLMDRHRLTRADLAEPNPVRHHLEPVYRSSRLVSWRRVLVGGIARINGCRVMVRSAPGVRSMELVGREGDVAVVRFLTAYLTREINRLARRGVAERLGDSRSARAWGTSFRLAAVAEVVGRLERESQQSRTGAAQAALVRLGRDEQALDELVEKLATGTARWSTRGAQDSDGRAAGRSAGRGLPLRRAVPEGAAQRQLGEGES